MNFYISWILLVFGVAWLIARFINKKEEVLMRILFLNAVYLLYTTNEWCDDGQRLSDWRLAHSLGPTTMEEHAELEGLASSKIGSYIIFCMAHGIKMDFDYIDRLWGLVEDWRS